MEDKLIIKGIEFKSRLWVGTGKYKDFEETKRAIEASGADVVTVAVRRVNIIDRKSENLLDFIDPKKYKILPNTAGCYTVEDALRYSRLAREAGVSDMIKLEVIGDEKTLFPDAIGLLEGNRDTGKRRVHRPSLYQRRPYYGKEACRCRGCSRHAACGADRLRAWHTQSLQSKDNT